MRCFSIIITVGRENQDFTSIKEAPVHTEQGITINKSCEINGLPSGETIIQAAYSRETAYDRVFQIQKNTHVIMKNLIIRHGHIKTNHKRGGGLENKGHLKMLNCDIIDNTAVFGAGIWNEGQLEGNKYGDYKRGTGTTGIFGNGEITGILNSHAADGSLP